MTRSSAIFAGFFSAFAVSCAVLVLAPQAQLGGLQPVFVEDEPGKLTDIYPMDNGAVQKGRAIYAREGCVACHTQQVRDPQNGTDIERGWGPRRTVARDYLFESPPFLGSTRLGPDLANAGWAEWRDEQKDDTLKPKKRDAAWHYAHLYNPRLLVPESNHPPYRYLFDVRKVSGQRASDAVSVADAKIAEPNEEAVPNADAKALVSYLLSLDRSHPLKEAGVNATVPPPASTAGAPSAPAAPAASTPPASTPAK